MGLLVKSFGSVEGQIKVACNSLSALNEADSKAPGVLPNGKHFDLIGSMQVQSAVNWVLRNIMGHQDEPGVPTVLDLCPTLNFEL